VVEFGRARSVKDLGSEEDILKRRLIWMKIDEDGRHMVPNSRH
jgi:hypothetical protein